MPTIAKTPPTAYEQKVYDRINKAIESGKYKNITKAAEGLKLSAGAYHIAKRKLKRMNRKKPGPPSLQTLTLDDTQLPQETQSAPRHVVIVTTDIRSALEQLGM